MTWTIVLFVLVLIIMDAFRPLSAQAALDLINGDAVRAFANAKAVDGIELLVERFVQTSLDALVERGVLQVQVKFAVELEPKEGRYMAFLRGTF